MHNHHKSLSTAAAHDVRRHILRATSVLLTLAAITTAAFGDEPNYPNKPMRLVVSVPAGGGIDAFTRVLGEQLSRRTGQGVVVENKPGATGAIAIQYMLSQPADGYTLYVAPDAAHNFVPLIKKMPYKPIEDFAFISRMAYTPNVVAVSPKIDAKTLTDFVALAKASPGKLNYGTMLGIPAQMDMELLKRGTGTDIVSVPYTGGATIVTGILDGSLDVTLFPITPLSSYIKAGKVRALAVTSSKRLASMPDVPTVAEAGFGKLGLTEGGYFGLVGPANMPAPIVAKLRTLVTDIVADPEFRSKIALSDFEPAFLEGDTYKQTLVRQLADNDKHVKSLHIKFE